MNQDDLTLCAFRYCLGRQSYIVSSMCDHLAKNWHEICKPFQKIIIDEIKEAIERDRFGHGMDGFCWLNLLKKVDPMMLKVRFEELSSLITEHQKKRDALL